MQKYIWTQFSSNHSSYFTVVGMFLTAEHAEQAAKAIQHIPETVEGQLNAAFGDDISAFYANCDSDSLDYLGKDASAWDRLVFVDLCINSPDFQGSIFVYSHILSNLGSIDCVSGYDAHARDALRFWITCSAPDQATAIAIVDEVIDYLEALRRAQAHFAALMVVCPPWGNSNDAGLHADDDEVTVLRDGLQVRFDLCFEDIQFGVPLLVEYLQARGCDNFDYIVRAQNNVALSVEDEEAVEPEFQADVEEFLETDEDEEEEELLSLDDLDCDR